MKTIFILLLGFAGVLPATCTKNKPASQSQNTQQVKPDTGLLRNDIALYGPAIIVVKKQPQRTV